MQTLCSAQTCFVDPLWCDAVPDAPAAGVGKSVGVAFEGPKPMQMDEHAADQIANSIDFIIDEIAAEYDEAKYPPGPYAEFLEAFPTLDVDPEMLSQAMIWKWGHWGKTRFPTHHQNLIAEFQRGWRAYVSSGPIDSADFSYRWWMSWLGRRTVFTSVAFLNHLIFNERGVPIVDQHNFRAMNCLIGAVRRDHRTKARPSRWEDALDLQHFEHALLTRLPHVDPVTLDRFLMMFGRNHVPRKTTPKRTRLTSRT
jgi:hypothetical protein